MRRVIVPLIVLSFLCSVVRASPRKDSSKDQNAVAIVMFWPGQDNAILKLTFSRFRSLASYGGKTTLQSDVIVQNLSAKAIPKGSLTVSLLDKNRAEVGGGTLMVNNLSAGALAQVPFQCETVGVPVTLSLSARNNEGAPIAVKTIPMTVISVPPGANLKVDSEDEGLTPATINISAGTHQLTLAKEGYAVATTPLEVAPDEAPGGSITITLGGLTDDTIELRDGSIITGDLMSMTLESVVIEINGQPQTFDRNKIKKIFLVERVVTYSETPAASHPKN
ncbi:MAG: PEGA domain-containing protein [Terriglobales bacterium]